MNSHTRSNGVHGPVAGNPLLRSLPIAGAVKRPAAGSRLRPPQVTRLGCLSTYDYLCHDRSCDIWRFCQHGGNRS
jgi:hypothetical protein